MSLNKQGITINSPAATSKYNGGVVPFDDARKAEAFAAAEKIVKSFHDLRGYVGVDFVLTEEEPVAIEVNPRLTTSYVGLSQVANFNPAQAILNAVLARKLPENPRTCGIAFFSKVGTSNPTLNALQEIYSINEVVSPPFPIDGDGSCALVLSKGSTLRGAMSGFRGAKKRLLDVIGGGA